MTRSTTVTPDGRTIIFTLNDYDEPWEQLRFHLHSVTVDGGEITRLPTPNTAQQIRPRVSPDGTTLVYGVQYEENY